ncbi:MAG TPA: dihydrolipoamide acetyltransferase family protein [Thermomicrobiaceae bacterium]|nr:dihydrolipoamide acetyltransferase family protein [Thermomicrobiaceae bacterium]
MTSTQQGTTVKLPKLGESVMEGTIGAWLKQVGDHVDKYEPIVEITTDKVNAEVPAPVAGVLTEITAQEGETLEVGAPICVISEPGSAATPAPTPSATPSANGTTPAATAAPTAPTPTPTPSAPSGPRNLPTGTEAELEVLRVRSSPAVRRIAEEHGVSLNEVPGSGVGGRVTKADIQQYVARQEAAGAREEQRQQPGIAFAERGVEQTVSGPTPAERVEEGPPVAPGKQVEGRASFVEVPVYAGDTFQTITPMRRQIAEHMVRSERTAPHVTTWMEVDMAGVVAARNRAKERFKEEEGFSLTYLPFVLKAVVNALREHPEVNASWDEANNRIIRRKAINIGVAVSLEGGLLVPVIKHADERSIAGLARAANDLATRARENKLTVEDMQGGTFTVNNPGTFGTVLSTPLIVQPQAAILSTEAVIKRPVVLDDAIAIRPIMNLSLSIDHRILDGLSAARFLGEVKRWLERFDPETSLY